MSGKEQDAIPALTIPQEPIRSHRPSTTDLPVVALSSTNTCHLFLAIQEARWRDAWELLQEYPDQASTWVQSKPKSPFDFNAWKRLPIHEACRGQAPAWFLAALLSAFPDGATFATQFDQLPLHIAVEFGASPEVVHLLLVYYADAIVAPDQSGRTPWEIAHGLEGEINDETKVVVESLNTAHAAYQNMQQEAAMHQQTLVDSHQAIVQSIQTQHAATVEGHLQTQENLQQHIQDLQAQIDGQKDQMEAKDKQIEDLQTRCSTWEQHVQKLNHTIAQLEEHLGQQVQLNQKLSNKIQRKQTDVIVRETSIATLAGDLQAVLATQETEIASAVQASEAAMRTMVRHQIALQKQLVSQTSALKVLLKERGIPELGKEKPKETTPEKEHRLAAEPPTQEQADEPTVDPAAMAEAALQALQV